MEELKLRERLSAEVRFREEINQAVLEAQRINQAMIEAQRLDQLKLTQEFAENVRAMSRQAAQDFTLISDRTMAEVANTAKIISDLIYHAALMTAEGLRLTQESLAQRAGLGEGDNGARLLRYHLKKKAGLSWKEFKEPFKKAA